MIEEGQPAPSFTLPSDRGEEVSLESLRGNPVVLYFYPQGRHARLHGAGVRDPRWLGGVRTPRRGRPRRQPDSPRSHARFKAKYALPFTLLADEEHEVAERYGTWVEKRLYGKSYMGFERSTFVIDENGAVVKVMRKVKPDTHAAEVLAALPRT